MAIVVGPVEITAMVLAAGNIATWLKVIHNSNKAARKGDPPLIPPQGPKSNGNGIGETTKLSRENRETLIHHGGEIQGCKREIAILEKTLDKLDVQNREDHSKIFTKLDAIRDAINHQD